MAVRIKLTWDDSNVAESGHTIYRSDTPMDPESLPTALATLAADVVEYFDETVTEGSTYYYRVGAFNGAEELVSGEVSVVAVGGLWTPLNMSVIPQIYLDAQDSVVTDVAGFAAAISNLGAMGASGDFLQTTADNRPSILAAELNGKRVLRFDGGNDVLIGSSADQKNIFRGVSAAWIFIVYKKRSADVTPATRALFYSTVGGNTLSRFSVYAGLGVAGEENKPLMRVGRLDADTTANLPASSAHSGTYVMVLHVINYGSRVGRIYIDGEMVAENTTLTTAGSTSDTQAQEALSLGAFYTAGGATDADFAALAIGNTPISDDDIDNLFGWGAHNYELDANLSGGHPYKFFAPGI